MSGPTLAVVGAAETTQMGVITDTSELQLHADAAFNALADFASVGLTRFLLRQGLQGWTLPKALIDVACAIVIFFALGAALISYIHVVHPAGRPPLIDLSALFAELRQDGTDTILTKQDYWWLSVVLMTTVLPTLLHLSIAIFTISLGYLRPLRNLVISALKSAQKGSDLTGLFASAAIATMIVLTVWVPVVVIYFLAGAINVSWFNWPIDLLYGYAQLIDAV